MLGYAESLNRPEKNVTGVGVFSIDLEAKRLELLHELVPSGLIAVLSIGDLFRTPKDN